MTHPLHPNFNWTHQATHLAAQEVSEAHRAVNAAAELADVVAADAGLRPNRSSIVTDDPWQGMGRTADDFDLAEEADDRDIATEAMRRHNAMELAQRELRHASWMWDKAIECANAPVENQPAILDEMHARVRERIQKG